MRNLFNWAAARLVAAFALTLPLAAIAIDYTGTDYEPWSYSTGCVAWRATESLFHASTVVDVPADGTIVEEDAYAFDTGHPWQVFASNQSAYSEPGKVLVYDVAGKTAASDAQFAPLSFGGMWVKVLQAEGVPYSITDNKTDTSDRKVELGATGASTYFKFDESFTFDRNSATKVLGTATVEIASGKTFTINARAGKGAAVDAGNTLALKGAGTLAVVGGLSVDGTLDLSAATRPSIDGDVTLKVYSTIVLPAGATSATVCSGTLTVPGPVYVKVGVADTIAAELTVENGTIAAITPVELEQTFTEGFPSVVPAYYTYTFVGGETPEAAVDVSGVEVKGTLKTTGYIAITGLQIATGGTLDVVDGNTSATAYNDGYDNIIRGNIIVRANASLTTTQNDFIDWYGATAQKIDVYGTLALGTSRWSIKTATACTFNLYPGAVVSGTGDANGVLDLIAADSKLNVYPGENGGEVVVEGKVKTRNANTPIWVAANTTLKIGGLNAGGVNKSGDGTLEISGTISNPAASTVSEGTVAFVDTTVAVPLTVNAGKTVSASASEGVTVPLNATMNAGARITVSGAGTVNGSVTFGGFPTGTLTGLNTSTWKGSVTVPAASGNLSKLADCGNADSVIDFAGTTGPSYIIAAGNTTYNVGAINFTGNAVFDNGSSGSTVNFAKISGTGDLTLAGWAGASSVRYNLNEVDGYSGTLTISNGITRAQGGTLTIGIGNIVSETTTSGSCVLPITNAAIDNPTGTVVYNLDNATLNSAAANLEARSDGIYVVPTIITVPVVANTTVAVTADGDTVAPTSEGANTYEVPYGAAVVVTYTVDADAYEIVNGTIEFTATESTEVTAPTVTPYVAWIYDGNDAIIGKYKQVIAAVIPFGHGTGEKARFAEALDATYHNMLIAGCSYDATTITYTRLPTVAVIISASGVWTNKYPTIAAAVGDAAAGDTITLVDNVALAESVEIAAGKNVTIDLNGKTITGPSGGYAFSNAGEVTIENGTITGASGVAENTADGASIAVSSGSYTATGDLFGNVEGGTIAVSGGTFNQSVADEYIAEGYEVTDNGDGTYGVRVDRGWIYEAADYPNYTGSWSNDVVYTEGKARIEDGNTYTANRPSVGQLVTVAMTLSFDDINDDDGDVGDAKAAVRLAAGETDGTYQFQLYTSDGGNKVWTNATVDVVATNEVDYTFVFVLDLTNKFYTASIVDGATTNVMTVGGATNILFACQTNVAPVQKIEFIGSGTVSSIEGSYEDAPAPVDEFVNGQEIGSVTLDTAQATWLNDQNNYAALRTKIESMSQAAFNAAYLLNLNILDENYQDYQEGDFVVTDFAFETESETEYVVVEVTLERHGALDGGINGTLKLTGAMQLGGQFETKTTATISDDDFSEGNTATLKLEKSGALFYKPVIE